MGYQVSELARPQSSFVCPDAKKISEVWVWEQDVLFLGLFRTGLVFHVHDQIKLNGNLMYPNKNHITRYIRDGRAPIPYKEATSRVMSANRGKDTGPEKKLRLALSKSGFKGSRSHLKSLPGRPDICYPAHRFAIYVNGCFWHHCPYCKPPLPKSHQEFWKAKFEKNRNRDRRKRIELRELGWNSITVWECQIEKNIENVIMRIRTKLEKS